MSELKSTIQEDMKAAMKSKDQRRLNAIRLILAAVKQREIDERITLDDQQIWAILEKMIKQRRDSITQYDKAGRTDLSEQENFEITVIQHYLPPPLSESEIEQLIEQAISTTSATSIKDMGKVMGQLKPKIQGRADTEVISKRIKDRLT